MAVFGTVQLAIPVLMLEKGGSAVFASAVQGVREDEIEKGALILGGLSVLVMGSARERMNHGEVEID